MFSLNCLSAGRNCTAIRANHAERMLDKITDIVFIAVENDHAYFVVLRVDKMKHGVDRFLMQMIGKLGKRLPYEFGVFSFPYASKENFIPLPRYSAKPSTTCLGANTRAGDRIAQA